MTMIDYDVENRDAAIIAHALSDSAVDRPAVEKALRTEKRIRFFLTIRKRRRFGNTKKGLWKRTDLKQRSADILKQLEEVGPQLIGNAKEVDKERAVLLLESEMDAMLEALTDLSKPRYATGQDLFRDLAHDSPASEVSTAPRKKVFQNRRSLADALSAGR